MERKYAVLESGAVYYTRDMEEMMRWFERRLGWYARADWLDEEGRAVHAVVSPAPHELTRLTLTPFAGIHLLPGESEPRVPVLIRVDNISEIHRHMTASGWAEVTEPEETIWGGLEFEAGTPDGGRLRFFQLD